MDSAIIRLLKVLDLERKQGYRNKAVIGGLDKFASRWETDARAETDNAAVISEIVSLMLGYAVVEERPARERILDLITRRAQSLTSGEAPPKAEGAPGIAAPTAPAPEPSRLPAADSAATDRPRERASEPLAPRASKPLAPAAPTVPPAPPTAAPQPPAAPFAPIEQRPAPRAPPSAP